MINAIEIQKMSATEKLQTMELLWKAISVNSSDVVSPQWHEQVLQNRLSKVNEGKGIFSTLDQIKERHRS